MNKAHYALLAIFLAAFPLLAPNGYWVHIGQSMGFIAIAVIGLSLLLGLSGQLSLGQGALYALGAYGTAITSTKLGWPLWTSIPFGVLVATCGGALMGLIAYRTRAHFLAMATLAFGYAIDILGQRWVGLTGGSMGIIGIEKLNFGSREMGNSYYFWVVALVLFMVQLLSHFIISSSFGRRLRAVKASEAFAQTIGLNVSAWRSGILIFACALGGLSGALFAHQSGYVSSDAFGFYRSITFLFAAVLGGLAHPAGGILGAIILVSLVQAMSGFHEVQLLIFGGVVLGMMLFFPGGAARAIQDLVLKPLGLIRESKALNADQTITIDDVFSPISTAKDASILTISNVDKSYGAVRANEDVSVNVKTGTVHALIGPNGAGKSTLVNLITGHTLPDRGRIEFASQNVTGMAAANRAKMGLARTFQNLQLIDELTVLENVMLGLTSRRSAIQEFFSWLQSPDFDADERSKAYSILSEFRLAEFANAKPTSLSYGHRKLTELARAVAQRPALMVLDEPVAGLNEKEVEAVAKIIRKLQAQGVSVLIIEHNIPFVMSIADHVSVLDYGKIIASGLPDVIQRDEKVLSAYLGAAA